MKLAKSHKDYKTFIAPFGRYRFFWLPLSLTSATEYFQKVACILKEQERYLIDDVLVFELTRSERKE